MAVVSVCRHCGVSLQVTSAFSAGGQPWSDPLGHPPDRGDPVGVTGQGQREARGRQGRGSCQLTGEEAGLPCAHLWVSGRLWASRTVLRASWLLGPLSETGVSGGGRLPPRSLAPGRRAAARPPCVGLPHRCARPELGVEGEGVVLPAVLCQGMGPRRVSLALTGLGGPAAWGSGLRSSLLWNETQGNFLSLTCWNH